MPFPEMGGGGGGKFHGSRASESFIQQTNTRTNKSELPPPRDFRTKREKVPIARKLQRGEGSSHLQSQRGLIKLGKLLNSSTLLPPFH